jgi:hypothetical protein
MGADIHFVVEQKHNDKWVGVFSSTGNYDWIPTWDAREKASPFWKFTNRNYKFFGSLANVRREGPDPLGIPADVSDLADMHIAQWSGDGHSHSYLPLKDFVLRWLASDEVRLAETICDKMEGDNTAIFKALNLDEKFEEDVALLESSRVVFWFDN